MVGFPWELKLMFTSSTVSSSWNRWLTKTVAMGSHTSVLSQGHSLFSSVPGVYQKLSISHLRGQSLHFALVSGKFVQILMIPTWFRILYLCKHLLTFTNLCCLTLSNIWTLRWDLSCNDYRRFLKKVQSLDNKIQGLSRKNPSSINMRMVMWLDTFQTALIYAGRESTEYWLLFKVLIVIKNT